MGRQRPKRDRRRVRPLVGGAAKGTTAGRLTRWLPVFRPNPAVAAEETRRRASNKGPRGRISNRFTHAFAEAYAEKKSGTYALTALRETPQDYHIPSRSAVYRLMDRGELLGKTANRSPTAHPRRRDLRADGHELKTLLTDNGPEFLHEDTLEALLRAPPSATTASCAPTTPNPPTSPS